MFRFTIRDVLWLTVVVALSVAWWVDNKRIEKVIARLEKEGRQQRAARDDEITVLRELQEKQEQEYSRLTGRGLPDLLSRGPPRLMKPLRPRPTPENTAAEPNP
jgi:hypothetical protein